MISIKMNSNLFRKEMNNIVEYSLGFLDGVQSGKPIFLKNIGELSIESLKNFIDVNAKVNPPMLQHVYEWYKNGSPESRLFDINYTVSGSGISFSSTFFQSSSIKNGSNVPFYNKARIMENGIPVVISPRMSEVLVFEDKGETIFTKNSVVIENPGGTLAQGGFEKTFDLFFTKYFSQSFLKSSGVLEYIKNPKVYKTKLAEGKKNGKSAGISTGYKWIVKAGVA